MQKIDPAAVFAALKTDPQFSAQVPKDALPVFEKFVVATIEQLSEKVGEKATIGTIVSTKITALEVFSNGLGEFLRVMGQEDSTGMMQGMMKELIEGFRPFAENATKMMVELGINEEAILMQMNMQPDIIKSVLANEATIGDILLKNPVVIFKNT